LIALDRIPRIVVHPTPYFIEVFEAFLSPLRAASHPIISKTFCRIAVLSLVFRGLRNAVEATDWMARAETTSIRGASLIADFAIPVRE
jgi:hypothetical protein